MIEVRFWEKVHFYFGNDIQFVPVNYTQEMEYHCLLIILQRIFQW